MTVTPPSGLTPTQALAIPTSVPCLTPSRLVSTSFQVRPRPFALVLSSPLRSPSTQLELGTGYTAPPSGEVLVQKTASVARVTGTATADRSNLRYAMSTGDWSTSRWSEAPWSHAACVPPSM